jgi:hypothetical protein
MMADNKGCKDGFFDAIGSFMVIVGLVLIAAATPWKQAH